MSDCHEFDKADVEAGVEVLPAINKSLVSTNGGDIMAFRRDLVQQYHSGSPSLLARLKAAGKEDSMSLVVSLIDEIIGETDELKGNQLVALQNGELRDASVISFKRAEVLEKAIKAVQAKQEFEKDSGIDIESPSMMVIVRFFMEKSKEAFAKMEVGAEISDLFFRTFGEVMGSWKKELREKFDEVKNTR